MKSRATNAFWAERDGLSEQAKLQARQAFAMFTIDPSHSSLRFNRVHAARNVYSINLARGLRALGVYGDDAVTWFWIGTFEDYERVISRS